MKQENEKYCHECAAIINTTAEICSSCGVRQVISEEIITSSFSQKLDHNKEQDLKDAKLTKTLGVLSIVLVCCNGGVITIVLGILAISKGKTAIQEFERNPGKYSLHSYNQAKSGKSLGIIGLILSGLHLIALVIYFILVFAIGIAGGLQ
jgi:hypothetical protein